jgi:hypothetical protein
MLTFDDMTPNEIDTLARIGAVMNVGPSTILFHINHILLVLGHDPTPVKQIHTCRIDRKALMSIFVNRLPGDGRESEE